MNEGNTRLKTTGVLGSSREKTLDSGHVASPDNCLRSRQSPVLEQTSCVSREKQLYCKSSCNHVLVPGLASKMRNDDRLCSRLFFLCRLLSGDSRQRKSRQDTFCQLQNTMRDDPSKLVTSIESSQR